MKTLLNLCVISNDKFYKNKYTNHNDLGSIIEVFETKYNIKIIGRNTKTKFKFLTIKKKVKFLNFFSFKIFNNIKSLNKNTKFLFISLTPFNLCVFLLLKLYFKKNFFLYLRSNGFNEYKIIFGTFGKLFYYLMLLVIIKHVKLIITSVDLNFKKSLFYLVRPSELTSIWFKKRKKNSTTPLKLLYLGRFRKEKGIKDFIKLISSSDLNFELNVYGLDYNNKFKSNSKIKYFPQITGSEKIIKAYDYCNIFILPSYTESAPKVIWESLARLRPVIVFEEIAHVARNKIGVYVCKRNLIYLIKTIEHIKSNYISIQMNIKKNKFSIKNEFQQEFKNILN